MTMASSSSSSKRSSSPFNCRRASSTPFSSTSSSSSAFNPRFPNRSCSSSASSFFGSSNSYGVRSRAPAHSRIDSAPIASKIYLNAGISAEYSCGDDLTGGELLCEEPRSGDSISVTIRFRPLSEREFQRGDEVAWHADGDKIVRSQYNTETAYAFDKVFGPVASSDEVYEVAAGSVVKSAMEGVNGTVFAYGVTSSGKTHTMHGGQNSPGIIQLAIKDVFSIIQDTPGREFLLRVSYIEIYNEVINDLLDPTCQNLRVREDVQGTYVEGIKEEVVLSPGHALSFIAAGEEHRHVGSNNFNLLSSRSHTIFTLMIESSAHGDEYDGVIFSQLNLIDLAGSESSKTETTGLRRKEGSYINKSLLTLGTVIGKLSEGRASHIPYRDSKLTRLLQSSLSGHGHVSLICTVTPASSSMEETHNTLKFANRAKRVEIFASLNKIIDEKSLIKKYQREISSLKQELDHLKKGVIANVSNDEILSLKQQLEEGQVKMQSRLEEEEEAKSALMSRIQRLTKLILVSTKNNIPGCLSDTPHQQSVSLGEDDNLDTQCDDSLHEDSDSLGESLLSHTVAPLEQSSDIGQISSIQRIESMPIDSATIGETNERAVPISDEMDLLVEQVKMLAGEIALGTSTLKRLAEQSTNGSECSKTQVQSIEHDIQEKQQQIRALEKRITESGVASLANTSIADMQQAILRMMTRCNEKAFDLEIKSADNRILQEQLQNKCREVEELKEKLDLLQQKFISFNKCPPLPEHYVSRDVVDEMRIKIHRQETENDRLKLEHIQLSEDYSGLCVQNQKLAEESSYAKELASAAAIELKNLTDQITKLSVQNARVEKELSVTRELAHSRSLQNGNGGNRKHNDGIRGLRRVHASGRGNEVGGNSFDDFDMRTLNYEDLKMELQTRKQREVALEAALDQREIVEDVYRKKIDDAKKREAALENDLANMWVLVAQLKKRTRCPSRDMSEEKWAQKNEITDNMKTFDFGNSDSDSKEDCLDLLKPIYGTEEPLVVRLKAKIQDMKEKDLEIRHGNGENPFNVLFE